MLAQHKVRQEPVTHQSRKLAADGRRRVECHFALIQCLSPRANIAASHQGRSLFDLLPLIAESPKINKQSPNVAGSEKNKGTPFHIEAQYTRSFPLAVNYPAIFHLQHAS